jgi:Flp pilus assembly protein TadD
VKHPNHFSAFMRHDVALSLLIHLSVLVILLTAHAQQAAPASAPLSPQPAPAVPEQSVPSGGASDYSKEASIIESLSSSVSFENDGTGRRESSIRVRVQSEAGVRSWGQLRFGYNASNESLEISSVHVLKPDGSAVTAGPDAIQDLAPLVQQIAPVYTDYHEKHVTVPGLRPGDILEFKTVTVINKPFAPGQFWMQYDFNHTSIVLDERLQLSIPSTRSVKLKTKPGMDPTISEEGEHRIYRWTSSNRMREDETDKAATGKTKKKKKPEELPAVQLTTFGSWEDVGQWYASLEKDRRAPSRDIRVEADALTKGLSSDLEKAEALYDYVAKNFRYVSLSLGLARYQPTGATDVLHNQYGDCKDKNTLLASLLEAEHLHTFSVLINSMRKIDPDVPSPLQFNHVITLLSLGNDKIWMDTTTEVAPFRLISANLRKKQALVIPPDGTPHLEETPSEPGIPDTDSTQIAGKISDDGKLEGRVDWTMRGDLELSMRMWFRRIPSAQWQKSVEALNKDIGGDISGLRVTDPSDTHEPFSISYDVSKANFLDWQKKKVELKLPLSVFRPLAIGADVGEDDENQKDESPDENFKLGPPSIRTYSLTLEFASRYSPRTPVAITLDRDYANYQSTYKLENSIFSAQRKLTIRISELAPSRADDYRAFRNGVLADAAQSLAIESTNAITKVAPSGMSAGELVKSGNEARNNGNYALAIDLLNRAVETDPKNKLAWNDLGLAYFDSRQDDLAANAYHKQLEINPYDQYAYNNLGRICLRQRKYDEAEKWFLKQIEVTPLDKYAHHNLGITYVEWHKYEQAIPELDRAASILPNNADPQVRLGEAYLNLGQDDKAMAAFDRAVQISATPNVWNNIAYQLSLKKAHLERARSYAESAVSSTSASLRNISLDSIDRRQLGLTPGLANDWDTLGWVAFAEGNLNDARRFVSAAWQLDQDSDVADHLGQIYEKSGNKEEATHFYALSLSARRPDQETRERLATLVTTEKVDSLTAEHQKELLELRTVKLKNSSKKDGSAAFFILLGPGEADLTKVEAVKFVSGSESVKDMGDTLRTAKFSQAFPDASSIKVLRRGILSCTSTSSDCTFVLDLPEDVRSVD